MPLRGLFASVVGCLVCSAPSLAYADSSDDPPSTLEAAAPSRWDRRRVALLGHVGSTPFGTFGLSGEVAPLRWLVIEGGGGWGLFGDTWRAGVMPRARIVGERVAAGIGAGVSVGPHRETNEPLFCLLECNFYRKDWRLAPFGGALLDIEGMGGSGFVWRVYGGAALVLDPHAYECNGRQPCPVATKAIGYAGIAAGYALP